MGINIGRVSRLFVVLAIFAGALTLSHAMTDAAFVDAMKTTDAAARLATLKQTERDTLTIDRVKALADIISQDTDPKVREKAAEQISHMAKTPALFTAISYAVPRIQQGMLMAGNTDVFQACVNNMLFGDTALAISFRQEWKDPLEKSPNFRNLVTASSSEQLAKLCTASNLIMRVAAARELAKRKSPQAYDLLIKLFLDTNGKHSDLLADLGDPRAVDVIREYRTKNALMPVDDKNELRCSLARLGANGFERDFGRGLISIMRNDKYNDGMRFNAAKGLAKFALPELFEDLKKLATDSSSANTQMAAYIALMGYPQKNEIFRSVLNKRDWVSGSFWKIIPITFSDEDYTLLSKEAYSIYKDNPIVRTDLLPLTYEFPTMDNFELLRSLAENVDPKMDPYVPHAMMGIGRLKDKRATSFLLEQLAKADIDGTMPPGLLNGLVLSESPLAVDRLMASWRAQPTKEKALALDGMIGGVVEAPGKAKAGKYIPADDPLFACMRLDKELRFIISGRQEYFRDKFSCYELSPGLLTLVNNSDRAMIIAEVRPVTNQGEEVISLSTTLPGRLKADAGGKEYTYSADAQGRTMPVTNGFLLPGQVMQIAIPFRAVSISEECSVMFYLADKRYDGTAASLTPFTVCIPTPAKDGKVKYAPFEENTWKAYADSNIRITADQLRAGARNVVVSANAPQQWSWNVTWKNISYYYETDYIIFSQSNLLTPFQERAKVIASMITKLPADKFSLSYSKALGGYQVTESENKAWLLKNLIQTEAGTPFIPLPSLLLKDIDNGDVQIALEPGTEKQVTTIDGNKKLWGSFAIIERDKPKAMSLTMTPKDMPAFLETLRQHEGKIIQTIAPDGARTYSLTAKKQ